MLPLSVCVITYNEERNIVACLQSVEALADEVVVVDSHSTDRTREIAQSMGARVIERDWTGHIDQKNFAIDNAKNQWVLCLDADERVSPELGALIVQALADGSPAAHEDVDGYVVNRRTFYLGRFINHCGWYPDRKLRLFNRERGRWGGVNPHDRVNVEGATEALDGDLHHYSYDDIADHLKTIDFFSGISAAEKVERGQGKLFFMALFAPPLKFLKMFVLKLGFLDGRAGLIVCGLGAYYEFLKYARAWELRHVKGVKPRTGKKVGYGRRGEAPAQRDLGSQELLDSVEVIESVEIEPDSAETTAPGEGR